MSMGLYAQIALVEGEEAREESNGVGYNVMKLGARKSQEIQEKGMRRERKPAIYVRKKYDPLTVPRKRLVFSGCGKTAALARNHAGILVPQQHVLSHD